MKRTENKFESLLSLNFRETKFRTFNHLYLKLIFIFLEPKYCGRIFENDGYTYGGQLLYLQGWAPIYDGAELGEGGLRGVSLYRDPVYVGSRRLSLIHANEGYHLKQ